MDAAQPPAATAQQPRRRAVKPRADRYCLDDAEAQAYAAFVEMLAQLDKGARLQLAESAVKEAAQQAPVAAAPR